MAKGYQAHQERQEEIARFGKTISKRAGFKCEWCEGKDDLRVWDYSPDSDVDETTLALLCRRCLDLAGGGKAKSDELRSIRNALWSNIPAVSAGAARVLARCKEPWVREAIEESLLDDDLKTDLLK